ncbi:MAG: CBS domain-containing protein [Acidobacteria bacterium]|nr:CBS domain-containing protein [Acidobacteriota bacterium]
MKIGRFVTQQQLVTVSPDQTLSDAGRQMIRHRVGSAVVIAKDDPPGIITERDMLRAIADGVDLDFAKVSEYMVPKAVTVTDRWHVVDAAETMIDRGFRHLVVVDEDGKVTGIISIRDMVRALLDDRRQTLAG